MSTRDDTQRAWYQEPFVWMVIAFPAAAVIAGFVTMYLAVASWDGLVVDDYYKRGLEINRLLDRERRAAELGLALRVAMDAEAGTMVLTLDAAPGFEYPPAIDALVFHATREGLDRTYRMTRVGDAMYRATGVTVTPGRWYVEVGTPGWRVTRRFTTR